MSIISKNSAANPFIFTDSIYNIKEKISYSVFDYEGENNRNILMVFPKALENKEREFLEKVLSALKLSIHDCAILGVNKFPNLGIADVKKYFAPKKIIFFGTPLSSIGIDAKVPAYTLVEMDSYTLILADPLLEISAKEEMKRKIWDLLKTMFNV